MTDLQKAKNELNGHTIALVKGETVFTSRARGVAPMLEFLDKGEDLEGFSVADKVVGKAAAMLFVRAGVAAVYAETLSKSGAEYLTKRNVMYEFGTLTDKIINRDGTDVCPMEKAVLSIDDEFEGERAIREKREQLSHANR